MRDAISPSEETRLVQALRAGFEWAEVRGMLPGVDPVALDRGFRDRCFKRARIEEDHPPQSEGPKPKKKG